MLSPSAWFTLILTLLVAALLIADRVRPDLLALMVLAALGLSGVVPTAQIFSGFSGPAVMTLIAISILSEGLRQSGVTRALGSAMFRPGRTSESRLVLTVTLVSAGLSLFMNNIAAVGVLLPAVMTLARKARSAPSRLLLPLAYGTGLGGMATLLTNANLIVSAALRDAGFRPFGMLDFLPIGGPLVLAGGLYMLLGRRLLPNRQPSGPLPEQKAHTLARLFGLEAGLHEIEVLPNCPLAGRTLAEGRWAQQAGMQVLALARPGLNLPIPPAEMRILGGDRLLVQGAVPAERLEALGLRLLPGKADISAALDAGTGLDEVVVAPHGGLEGRTLAAAGFREKYRLNVLGIWREGQPLPGDLCALPLRAGDALLVQASAATLQRLQTDRDLVVLEEDPDAVLKPRKFALALGITAAAVGVAIAGLYPISLAAFAGAVLMVLTGCVDLRDAYRSVEWQAVFLIAGMWPLSIALRTSGLADAAVNALLTTLGQTSPLTVAAGLLGMAALLTQIMSGQVAALAMAPLALAAAARTGADPRALGMAVALGCSLTFATPFAHPVNVMVMTPGGYKFRDFLRAGLPLVLLSAGLILFGLHLFWGL